MNKEINKIKEVRVVANGSNVACESVPAWWLAVPEEEKKVIRDVLLSVRGLKRSQSQQVAIAAAKWERTITRFIKCRLMSGVRRARRVAPRVISSPTSSRSQPSASPSQG